MIFPTQYTAISAPYIDMIYDFDNNLRLYGSLQKYRKDRVEDKLDAIIDRVHILLLDCYPVHEFNFQMELFKNNHEVKRIYLSLYGADKAKDFDAPAFISRSSMKHGSEEVLKDEPDVIHISVQDVHTRILAHEFAHVCLDSWYDRKMPIEQQHRECWYVEREINS